MSRKIIQTDNAPQAIGPYSQGVAAQGQFIFVSGQVGIDPTTGSLAEGVEAQAQFAMQNVRAVLQAAGADLSDAVKMTVLLHNIEDFPKLNAIYGSFFETDPPARATFGGLDLPLGALVEIECMAVIEN